MSPADFSDDVDPKERETPIEIRLGPAEMRKVVEHVIGGPAIRVWITLEEALELEAAGVPADWTAHKLSDGRLATWRPARCLDQVEEAEVRAEIESRIITDDVT